MCFTSGGPWQNPFIPEPFPAAGSAAVYTLGQKAKGSVDSITIPMATTFASASAPPSPASASASAPAANAAFTVLLSLDDPLLEVELHVSSPAPPAAPGGGSQCFWRKHLRVGGGRIAPSRASPLLVHAHIAAHSPEDADWRSALRLGKEAFPRFFHPVNPAVVEYEGLAGYSWNLEQYDRERAQSLGFKTTTGT
jgi:hypothetical protein